MKRVEKTMTKRKRDKQGESGGENVKEKKGQRGEDTKSGRDNDKETKRKRHEE